MRWNLLPSLPLPSTDPPSSLSSSPFPCPVFFPLHAFSHLPYIGMPPTIGQTTCNQWLLQQGGEWEIEFGSNSYVRSKPHFPGNREYPLAAPFYPDSVHLQRWPEQTCWDCYRFAMGMLSLLCGSRPKIYAGYSLHVSLPLPARQDSSRSGSNN